jgi:glucose/arabinose dehydrogenase
VALYSEAIAPSGATFVSMPGSEWSGDFLIGALVGEQIRRLRFDSRDRVVLDEALFEGEFGRIRTVVEGPDGALFALTTNLIRGTAREGDDRILRIVPPAGLAIA